MIRRLLLKLDWFKGARHSPSTNSFFITEEMIRFKK